MHRRWVVRSACRVAYNYIARKRAVPLSVVAMSFAFDFGGNDFEVDDAIVDSRSDKGAAEVGGQGDGVQTASKASQTARSAADAAESRGKRTDVPPARRHTLDDLVSAVLLFPFPRLLPRSLVLRSLCHRSR